MDKKTTPTHVVIDQDYIQQLPNKMKKPFLLYGNDWQNYLASLPKILRADEGKWEIGQQLTEHVDFEQQGQPISLYGRYGKNIAKCSKCGKEWVWDSGNDCDCPPVAVPLEAPAGDISNYTSTNDFLKDFVARCAQAEPLVISDEDRQWLEQQMDKIDREQRRRAAQAFIDLSKIIITI
jgi:hypothetical protein